MKSPHVIIIGAGCAGLALAQGLRRAGVSCAVYEARRGPADGLDGYRVGIDLTGSRALKKCLPPEVFAAFLPTCARAPRYLTVLTEKMEVTAAIPVRGSAGGILPEHSVSSRTLRQLLLTGLADRVHFAKEFTRYEQQADGTVTAFFADGSRVSGQLLVAADGAHSAVRAQYLPQALPQPPGIVTIGAKVPLTRQVLGLLPARSRDGLSVVLAPRGLSCVCHVIRFGRGSRDYLGWGLWAAQDVFPTDVLRLPGQQLVELVLRLTARWHRDFRKLFSLTDPATPVPVRIATAESLPGWRPSNITLVGDAIHPMAPGQRVGANVALRDAMLLSRALAAVRAGDVGLVNAVAAYEAEMKPPGFPPPASWLFGAGASESRARGPADLAR